MNIALPIWNERISPVFDTSRRIMVVRISESGSEDYEEIDVGEIHPAERVKMLEKMDTDILICGAVSNPVARLLAAANIRTIPWISGPVEEVMAAFRRGELDEPCYRMPGCGGMGRRRRQRGFGRGRGRRREGAGSRYEKGESEVE
jgi:predicted Fe-Mo cluster-binding NifX family protein